jgi:hypothetical protein
MFLVAHLLTAAEIEHAKRLDVRLKRAIRWLSCIILTNVANETNVAMFDE